MNILGSAKSTSKGHEGKSLVIKGDATPNSNFDGEADKLYKFLELLPCGTVERAIDLWKIVR